MYSKLKELEGLARAEKKFKDYMLRKGERPSLCQGLWRALIPLGHRPHSLFLQLISIFVLTLLLKYNVENLRMSIVFIFFLYFQHFCSAKPTSRPFHHIYTLKFFPYPFFDSYTNRLLILFYFFI